MKIGLRNLGNSLICRRAVHHRFDFRLRRSTFFVLCRQFAVARSFIRVPGVVVNAFQGAAAARRFGDAAGAGMQRRQPLIQPQVARSLGQSGKQRPQSLRWHVVRDEEFGIGQRRPNRQRNVIGIALVDEGCGGFQFIHQGRAFFHRDQRRRYASSEPPHHLLVVAGMQRILRFQLRQPQVVIAGFLQISRLYRRVREQFVHLGDVSVFPSAIQKSQQNFKRAGVVAHMRDDGVQVVQNFRCVDRQQPVRVLLVHLQGVVVTAGADESVRVA